jgi:exopolysaccharide production protein ExoZ
MLLAGVYVLQLGAWVAGVGAACVVLGALNVRFSQWHSGFLRVLGDSSYSLYLTHIFTLGALRVVWVQWAPASTTASAWVFMLVSLGISAAVGWLVYRYVETPIARRLH